MTKAQRKKLSISMKASIAKKREAAIKSLENAASSLQQAQDIKVAMPEPAEDRQRGYEFHYRRGLVTAMECILRELR